MDTRGNILLDVAKAAKHDNVVEEYPEGSIKVEKLDIREAKMAKNAIEQPKSEVLRGKCPTLQKHGKNV